MSARRSPSAAPAPASHDTSEPVTIDYAEVTEKELEAILAEASDQAPKSIRESERVEHFPARPPPRPMTSTRSSDMALPKVIVALDPEHVILVERLVRGGETGEEAEMKLRALDASALPAIMDRFPGPTRCDRTTPTSHLPAPREAGPILSFLARAGRIALIDVIARTGDPAPETRFWATYLLAELIDSEAANALVPRLVDDDTAVRKMAAIAARALLQSEPRAASLLVDPLVGVLLDSGAPTSLRVRAAQALAEVRDARAAEGLVLGVDAFEREVAQASHEALVVLTRHDPSKSEHPDGWSWSTWYADHGARHRIEWLIEALMDEDESIREAAGAELKSTTKVYFGYYANLPRAGRKAAYDNYLQWWKQNSRKFTD